MPNSLGIAGNIHVGNVHMKLGVAHGVTLGRSLGGHSRYLTI